MEKTIRNPYPIPDLSREGVWLKEPAVGKGISRYDEAWAMGISPFHRLYAHQTLTMARKNPLLHRPKVPQDSLDLTLTRVYDHVNDTFIPKAMAVLQAETLNRETWRLLRNEIKDSSKGKWQREQPIQLSDGKTSKKLSKFDSTAGKSSKHGRLAQLRNKLMEEGRKRVHPSSIKLGMEGPHTDRTNPGFCRKIDGTFYGI